MQPTAVADFLQVKAALDNSTAGEENFDSKSTKTHTHSGEIIGACQSKTQILSIIETDDFVVIAGIEKARAKYTLTYCDLKSFWRIREDVVYSALWSASD